MTKPESFHEEVPEFADELSDEALDRRYGLICFSSKGTGACDIGQE